MEELSRYEAQQRQIHKILAIYEEDAENHEQLFKALQKVIRE